MVPHDALIIGGGPAGATLATLLAQAGKDVVVLEQDRFPRFHIGESLLPGSLRIFRRLGVCDEIHRTFVRKPGGKWMYGNRPLWGHFRLSQPDSSFKDTPWAYMVERAAFDKLLLENAQRQGAEVRHGHTATDLLWDGPRVAGVQVRNDRGETKSLYGGMVFDCSGRNALVANKLRLRRPNVLKRMAVFGHYDVDAIDPELRDGWFVGQMVEDGWIWLIPLGGRKVSIGVVITLEKYRETQLAPGEFLQRYLTSTPFLRQAIGPNPQLVDEVRIMGNLGYSSERLAGEGWVLAGDAAFFVDPCYSSGVHLAMSSAESAADTYLQCLAERDFSANRYATYEEDLLRHERYVTKMVEMFYLASRNRTARWLIPRLTLPSMTRRFNTFIGGDFTRNVASITLSLWLTRLVCAVCP